MQAEIYSRRGDITELDIVANYGWMRSGHWDAVEIDIRAVCEAYHPYGTEVKVISKLMHQLLTRSGKPPKRL